MTSPTSKGVKRRWRDYQTALGGRPVREALLALGKEPRAEVKAAMKDVQLHGLEVARHVRGPIYEVRASHGGVAYRLLFATEGRDSQVLLGLEMFTKKSRKTPAHKIDLALQRLSDWRARGKHR